MRVCLFIELTCTISLKQEKNIYIENEEIYRLIVQKILSNFYFSATSRSLILLRGTWEYVWNWTNTSEENPYKKILYEAAPYHTRAFALLSLPPFFLYLLLLVPTVRSSHPRRTTSRLCYNSRTALIILLFSNESVDADGSAPAHKMHGTGCVSPWPPLLSSLHTSSSSSPPHPPPPPAPSSFLLLLLLYLVVSLKSLPSTVHQPVNGGGERVPRGYKRRKKLFRHNESGL